MGGCCSHTSSDDEVRRKNRGTSGGRTGRQTNYTNLNHNERRHRTHGVDGEGKKVDLNLAGERELSTLPGISQRKAEAIVNYRAQHGQFKNASDVQKVPGIGQGTFNKIKDRVYVSHSTHQSHWRKDDQVKPPRVQPTQQEAKG